MPRKKKNKSCSTWRHYSRRHWTMHFMKNNCLRRHFGLILVRQICWWQLLNLSLYTEVVSNWVFEIVRTRGLGSPADSRQPELQERLWRAGGNVVLIGSSPPAVLQLASKCHYIRVGAQLKRSAGCRYFKIQWRTFSEETFISLVNSHEKFTFWQRCVCLVFIFWHETKPFFSFDFGIQSPVYTHLKRIYQHEMEEKIQMDGFWLDKATKNR